MKQTFADILGQSYGLEGESGVANREVEFTIYARMTQEAQLDNAEYREGHEQWRLPLAEESDIRIRLRGINENKFQITTKRKDGGEGLIEVDSDLSKLAFEQFKLGAVDGYKKVRFVFPIANSDLKWEVDAFYNQSGHFHDWVKIDLEVSDMNMEIPLFPISVEEVIFSDSPQLTKAEDNWIKRLWDVEWQRIDGVRRDISND